MINHIFICPKNSKVCGDRMDEVAQVENSKLDTENQPKQSNPNPVGALKCRGIEIS